MKQELKTLPLSEIIDHPQNAAIYGDGASDDLVESIRASGVINPVVAFYDSSKLCFVCLSGHRRRAAAATAGLKEIPAILLPDDLPEWQQIIWIIEANRQRQKTAVQVANESRELLAAKKIEAEHRMKAGKKSDPDPGAPVRQGTKRAPRAVDEVAKTVGIGSGRTVERAVAASTKAKELRDAGQEDKAKQIEETMERRGFKAAAALSEVIDKEPEPEPEESQEVILDEFGVPVPDHLRQLWIDAEELRALMRELSKLKTRIGELEAKPHGRWIDRQHAETLVQDLRSAIKFALPHVECGECRRNEKRRASCKLCRARGFVPEMVFKNSSREAKTWIENRSSK